MAVAARTFSKGEFIGGIVAALAVGFFVGSIFMEMRLGPQAFTQPAGSVSGQASAKDSDGVDHSAEQARIAELEIAMAGKPGDQSAWIELGNLYFDTHQALKSITAYEKAVAMGTVSPDVWTDMAIMHREAGQAQKAIATFDTALKLNPRHENALYNKGVVQMHDGKDRAGAIVTWEKLVQVNPAAKNPEGRLVKDMLAELKKG